MKNACRKVRLCCCCCCCWCFFFFMDAALCWVLSDHPCHVWIWSHIWHYIGWTAFAPTARVRTLQILMFHHQLFYHLQVVTMFGLFTWEDLYLAYLALTLLTEVNSIFLHARKLLQLLHFPVSHWAYVTNNFLNVSTFFFFVSAVSSTWFLARSPLLPGFLR